MLLADISQNDLKVMVRIFFKISFWFLLIVAIFFWNVKTVNLPWIQLTDKNVLIDSKKISFSKPQEIDKKIVKKIEISPLQKKRYLLSILQQALWNKHYSSLNKDAYKKICDYYPWWCKIIDISDEFNYQQKVYYLALSIYLFDFINHFVDLKDNLYYVKIQPEKIGRRWYAGHHSIILNVKKNMTYEQFFEVLTHETGHVVDLWVLVWNWIFKSHRFTEYWKVNFYKNDPSLKFYSLCWKSEKVKKPDIYISDFVSGYGMTDPFEDFAESFNMYLNHNYVFRQMATESNILREKYNFLAKLFKWKFIHSDKNYLYKAWFRPRDSTIFSE